jgi:predicted DCC family thiol-disulfide oxidoreductase YuxK
VRERDKAGRVLALPNQTPDLIDRYGLTRADVDWELWAIDPEGRRYSGAAAVNRTLEALGGVWRKLGAIYRVRPLRWIEDKAYRWVANHRPLMSILWGASPECGE